MRGPPLKGMYSHLRDNAFSSATSSYRAARTKNDLNRHLPNPEVGIPALRAELVSVWPEDVFVPMQRMARPPDGHALWHQDGLFPVWAAAAGEHGLLVGRSGICRYGAEQAQSCGGVRNEGKYGTARITIGAYPL